MSVRIASLVAGLLLISHAVCSAEEPGRVQAPGPSLAVVLVVDQLQRSRLTAELPGGLGRLARQGRVYTDSLLDHANTATCPGHQSILSGRHPGTSGIVSNNWIDPATGREVYCVEDNDAPGLSGGPGRSPRLIRTNSFGDWLRSQWSQSRVFSLAGKDRAAVTLGGQRPDAAFWFDSEDARGMTSSRYYLDSMPEWVLRFNRDLRSGFDGKFPEQWTHTAEGPRVDDYEYEDDQFSRVSGHPLWTGDPSKQMAQLRASPYLDDVILRFAAQLLSEENLGRGQTPDLLAIGLSATDLVGHLYGPESVEARAALHQLDRALGAFIDLLDEQFGKQGYLLVLTADHGVLPIPEWLKTEGRSKCPLASGRQGVIGLLVPLLWDLYWKFGPLTSMPGSLVRFADNNVTVNRQFAETHRIDPAPVIAYVESWMEGQDVVKEAWNHEEVVHGTGSFAELYRHSHDDERSGDLVLQFQEDCLVRGKGGTNHGSPYDYDREVPIVFMGPGVTPGRVSGPARTIDIAPTLADLLGVSYPVDLDGKSLEQ